MDTKSQLEKLRLAITDREFSCTSPEFSQRSQYLFLKLYDAGVIYQKKVYFTYMWLIPERPEIIAKYFTDAYK